MPHVPRHQTRCDDDGSRDHQAFRPQLVTGPAEAATEPRTDRRKISEGTAVVIKAGVIAGAIVLLSIWFHQRVNAVELKQVEQSTKLDAMAEVLRDIRADVKDLTRRAP